MFNWMFSRGKPKIPKLYPEISSAAFCQFLTAEAFEKIKRFPLVRILPFLNNDSTKQEALFGTGLSRLLIRNLMLIRNISVLGPEDTPAIPLEQLVDYPEALKDGIYVGGNVRFEERQISVDLEFLATGGKKATKTVSAADGPGVLLACSQAIAQLVGGVVSEQNQKMWQFGLPTKDFVASVSQLGLLNIAFERDDPEQTQRAVELFRQVPSMGATCSYVDCDLIKDGLRLLLDAFENDPYDPTLCFGLFIKIWQSRGHEPLAFQFIRRCIELSPGHGKAHMCAPHAAHKNAIPNMLTHSELGYRLLPRNPFAINNYIINLMRAGRPQKEILQLAEEGIESDPYDPGNYERMIDAFVKTKNFKAALELAKRLQTIYEPMHERTYYCLQQNPRRKQQLESGQYDPASENSALIRKLTGLVAGR